MSKSENGVATISQNPDHVNKTRFLQFIQSKICGFLLRLGRRRDSIHKFLIYQHKKCRFVFESEDAAKKRKHTISADE